MRAPLAAILGAAVLALTACGGSTSTVYVTRPATALAPSPVPATTTAAYDDAHACWAFHKAITKGVPASATGEDTMAWLQSQIGNADPEVQAALLRFINAWQYVNPGKIDRAQRAAKSLCAALG
jgi:hypothetical protein